MQLYEFGPTRSIRARWTLQELEVRFDAITVNLRAGEHLRPEFLRLNPAGKLPVLVDDDLVLTESVAIVLYLGAKYRTKGFLPQDLRGRAELDRWLFFTVTELEQPLWRMARHGSIYPKEQRLPADIAIASREFRQMAGVLESHMMGREFIVGDTVTVGDFVVAYTLDWASEAGVLDEAPLLRSYLERMYARPHAPTRIAAALAAAAAR